MVVKKGVMMAEMMEEKMDDWSVVSMVASKTDMMAGLLAGSLAVKSVAMLAVSRVL